MVELFSTLYISFFEVIIVYFFWYVLDIIFYNFLRFFKKICKNNLLMFDYLRRMYLVQRLSFFFEKSFFFLFSEHRFPRINFFKYLRKNKPFVLYFHIFKNRVNLKNFMFINLNFIIKQFNFFFTSFIFKNKAEKNIFNLNFFSTKVNFFFYFFILKKLFFKRFHRFLSFIFFYNFDYFNLIKLDFIFFIFLSNSKGLLQLLDMGKFYD